MLDAQEIIPSIYELLIHDKWSVRLGAMVVMEEISEKNDDKTNLAVGLGNAAQFQLQIGQFSASTAHLRKRIALCREINDEIKEAIA